MAGFSRTQVRQVLRSKHRPGLSGFMDANCDEQLRQSLPLVEPSEPRPSKGHRRAARLRMPSLN